MWVISTCLFAGVGHHHQVRLMISIGSFVKTYLTGKLWFIMMFDRSMKYFVFLFLYMYLHICIGNWERHVIDQCKYSKIIFHNWHGDICSLHTVQVSDQTGALFGECCFEVGDIKCTMGTGTFIDLNCGSSPHASVAGNVHIDPSCIVLNM